MVCLCQCMDTPNCRQHIGSQSQHSCRTFQWWIFQIHLSQLQMSFWRTLKSHTIMFTNNIRGNATSSYDPRWVNKSLQEKCKKSIWECSSEWRCLWTSRMCPCRNVTCQCSQLVEIYVWMSWKFDFFDVIKKKGSGIIWWFTPMHSKWCTATKWSSLSTHVHT